MEELLHKISILEEENKKLKIELEETKEHLKKYTAPKRSKKYYETHKEELLQKMKINPISCDKRKEYNKNYYLKKKETENI
jgi:membrane protein insertase Oxa1/YidC/SpoIIIJ